MATLSYEYTTPGTYTLAIPSNAKNVNYIIRGARGGNALAATLIMGILTPSPFQTGTQGQYITGTFDATQVGGETLTIYVGDEGKQASSNFGFDGGAAGGSGYYSGGSGGSAPGAETWVTAGGGSGGGGASAVVINGTLILCAGGGGGCGGSAVDYGGQVATYVTSLTTSTANAGNGLTGGSGSTAANGGSGGGGGGVPRGFGGAAQQAGNHIPGAAGGGGGGYYNVTAVTTAAVTTAANLPSLSTDGYFYVEFESGDPPTVQFQSNPAVIISGNSATLSWEVTAAPGDEPTSITLNGVPVSAVDTLVVSPTTSTDYTIVAVGPGGTTQDTISLVVIDGGGTGAGANLVFTYGTGNHTITIPANTTNAFLTLAGGRGGSGGSDAGGGGCGGAAGRVGVFEILPSEQERIIDLYVGTQGNNGASGSPGNKAGGTGGVSTAGNGGSGGRDSLGGGWSGSGGGGGGATGAKDAGTNTWIANVGGGGGGGGGSWNRSCTNGASAGGALSATAAVSAANGNGGANCGGDGGGGGGGGGGHTSGGGGGAGADNSFGGSSGGGGSSRYNNNYFDLDSQSTNNNNGYAVLSFVVPPTIAYFRANDDSPETDIQEGDAVVLSWSTLFNGNETATAAEIDNGIGSVPVGEQFTTILSPAVTTTYTLTVSAAGAFSQQQVTVNILPPDDVADQFTFATIEDAEISTIYFSDNITITGLDIPVDAFCTNGAEMSVNGGAYTSNTQTVNPGDSIRIRMESSNVYSTEKITSVSVGVTNTTFKIKTKSEPLNIPNAFEFEDVQDAPLNSYVLSNAVTITGLNVIGTVSAPVGAESSINDGPFSATTKLVNNGETIRLRVLTSGTLGDSITTGVSVGTGPLVPWTVTNVVIADDNPDFFDFPDKTDQIANTYVTSDILNITGITVPTAVNITNGQFRINGGSWVTSGDITNNQTLQLRLLSSTEPGGEVSTTVSIGNVFVLSDDWKVVTTTAGDIDPDAFYFIDQENKPPNTLVSSNVVQVFGITSPSPISISGGEMQINGGLWVTSGSINNGETLRLRTVTSANLSTPVSISITVG